MHTADQPASDSGGAPTTDSGTTDSGTTDSGTTCPKWYGLHIHRYTDQDTFLTDAVAPAVAPLYGTGEIDRAFFLRYWQGGHHIRLRFRLTGHAPESGERAVRDVADRLSAHLAAFPGGYGYAPEEFRAAQATMAALESEATDELRPPDSVHRVPYVPEYGKYGGEAGVDIAERFFDRSSAVALAALAGIGGSSAKRLGTAFSAMLRGLSAARLSPAGMRDFFAHYCVVWSPYVFDQFLDTWPDLLRQRRDTAAAYAGRLLGPPNPGPSSSPDTSSADPFGRAVGEAWRALTESAGTVLPAVTLGGPDAPARRRQQIVLLSYLHTHNNRLGLIPEQESFLGYLGHHVVSDCAGLDPSPELLDRVREHRRERLGAPPRTFPLPPSRSEHLPQCAPPIVSTSRSEHLPQCAPPVVCTSRSEHLP
ncbi:lantibiotic dehydratase C-terminal domain-containing protein [Streptomyces sp. NPDC088116]|uniref:lantibiotic dehydratase C-terminal domain-containing protein n=1 Tax=Streptomyces sp. NPDC088116 TaxID=3365825 RepID=UPI00381B37D2